ncbi:sterol carrier family protein [Streptomyces sp. ZYX-F-203]
MPPSRKPPRRYDPERTRAAVLAQYGHLRSAAGSLSPRHLTLPAGAGGRTVGDLVADLGSSLAGVDALLAGPEPARRGARLLDWPGAAALDPVASDAGPRAAVPPGDLDARLAEAERLFVTRLAEHPGDRLVPTPAGALPLADWVVTRALDLVTRADDLSAAVPGLEVPRDRRAVAAATRLLADTLADRAPGGTTEVRVPPHAVVQCVEGPRHTRGTPPHVVETDPLTWIRVATGRMAWADAVAEGLVTVRGDRADLGGLLPLTG